VTLVTVLGVCAAARQPAVDPTRLGPAVGVPAPPFSAVDQAGRTHSLDSVRGPKGTMLVFFRSADW
jgi:hypothetical protein